MEQTDRAWRECQGRQEVVLAVLVAQDSEDPAKTEIHGSPRDELSVAGYDIRL